MAETTLITGGAGFLGSHLCDRFIEMGHKAVCLDDLSRGRVENIQHLMENKKFIFMKHDIREMPKSLGCKYSNVLHFASPVGPKSYGKDAVKTLMTLSMGTKNALEIARKNGARFLLASTSEVYGDSLFHPQTESNFGNVDTRNERSAYSEGKRFSETLTSVYRREFRMNAKIARIFNTYGPRMSPEDGRVEPNFVNSALRGESLIIYGYGWQTRTFCYVDDMVDGLMKFFESDLSLVNLGSEKEICVREFAQTVLKVVGSESEMVSINYRPAGDANNRCPDLTLAKERLGWEPKTELEEGIRIMADDLRAYL